MPAKSSVFLNSITEIEESQEKFQKTVKELNIKKKEHAEIVGTIISALKQTKHYTTEKAERIADCGSFITVSPATGKITSANFCKNKLCPICQWRKSLKVYGEISQIQKEVEKEINKFIFMTLTLSNTKELSSGISHILKAFYNLSNDRTFKKMSQGYIRTLEITYNEKKGTWHPHIHLIIAVKKSYFKKDYTDQKKWCDIWERCAGITYRPIIDIRTVKEKSGNYIKAIAEISKYAIKPFQTDNINQLEIAYHSIYQSTHNRRLRSYGGIYAKIKKELNFNDGETTEDKSSETDKVYRFEKGHYIEIKNVAGEWKKA